MVALDECDKMLGLGFAPQLQRLARLLLRHSMPATTEAGTDSAQIASPRRSDADHAHSALRQPRNGEDAAGAKGRKERATEDVALVPTATVDSSVQPQAPQVLLFSATMADDTRHQVGGWLSEGAMHVDVAEDAVARMSSTVTQVVQVCAEHKKPAKLLKHLHSINAASTGARMLPRVLVFCNKIKVWHRSRLMFCTTNFEDARRCSVP
jgi:superfamily II DNA/RNA helicase